MATPATVTELERRLTSLDQQVRILGLGEGGLIALGFGDLTSKVADGAPHWILALFVTLVVVAGAMLARAWIGTHAATNRLVNHASTDLTAAEPAKSLRDYRIASALVQLAVAVLAAAGTAYLAAAWAWVHH